MLLDKNNKTSIIFSCNLFSDYYLSLCLDTNNSLIHSIARVFLLKHCIKEIRDNKTAKVLLIILYKNNLMIS